MSAVWLRLKKLTMISRQLLVSFLTIVILSSFLTYQLLLTEKIPFEGHTLRQILRIKPLHDHPVVRNVTGNVPDIYLTDTKKKKTSGKTCGSLPGFFDLRFRNNLWQLQKTSKGTFHLFNAYVDPRDGGSIKILATYDVHQTQAKFYCQFWYEGSTTPKTVESGVPFWMFYKGWGADKEYYHHPYLVTCPLVADEGVPLSVSLVERPCEDATNNLKVFNTTSEGKNFVVCVKGLSFPFNDLSTRLVEWIELLRLLGADKINFYEFSVHGNVRKVLDYYQEQGFVETSPITLVGDYSNEPLFQNLFLHNRNTQRRLQEVIPYNDCLYKHLQGYKYVVLLDTDEVIVPVEGTWRTLIHTLEKKLPNASSFMTRNVYFLDSHLHQHEWFSDIPMYMHMLQHVYRAKNYTKPGYFVKGFHDTKRVVALHNHFPFACLNGKCNTPEVDTKLVHLQHYRSDCVRGVSDCYLMRNNSVMDRRVWNFKEELIKSVNRTLTSLNLSGDIL